MQGKNRILLIVIAFLILGVIPDIKAQSKEVEEEMKEEVDTIFDTQSRTFLLLPLVINNPSFKTGFGLVPMFFFNFDKEDKVSPPSVASLVGLYSTNKSYVFLANGRFFWNEDRNRANLAFGPTRVNYDFDYETVEGDDIRLVYSELRSFIFAQYSRKIIGDFYLGALYLGTQTRYRFDQGTDEENESTKEFFEENGITDNFVSSIGINISFDNRDYQYYPTSGGSFSIRPKFFRSWLGSDNDYVDTDFNATFFRSWTYKSVLGFSLAGGFATGDVPFDGYQTYGTRNNLRGYPGGKYRGKHMVAFQAEYRRIIYNRWGAVGFAGAGSVWGNDQEEEAFDRSWLPSIGVGARYMVSKVKRINIRLDYAIGVDGNQGLYFGIMEAF